MIHRLVICGVPRAGKTTLANSYVRPVARHMDDLISIRVGWSEVSLTGSSWFEAPGPWIIEGVAAVRALRKWFRSHPEKWCGLRAPCDRVIWLDTPRVPLTPGQETMAKGCRTIWREVRPMLLARNVHVEEL